MKHTNLVLCLTGAALLLCACESSSSSRVADETPEPPHAEADSPGATTVPADGLADLRALPYAGYTDVHPDKAEDGLVVFDEQRSHPGYTLYTIQRMCRAELIDAHGKLVHHWQRETDQEWARATLLDNGDLLVIAFRPSQYGPDEVADDARFLCRFNWAGDLLWQKQLLVHHDVEQIPDGRLLALGFERRVVPALHKSIPLRDDQVLLLSAAGEPIESLSLFDTLSARPNLWRWKPAKPQRYAGRIWIDMFHSNSCEWMRYPDLARRNPLYALDNVLVSMRDQDRVAIINWPRKELLWQWGEGELSGQHDAQLLPNGRILVFDNGLNRDYSRILELDPQTRKIVWEYKADPPQDFYTRFMGSNQRLPNGNTLIGESLSGRAFEVTPQGETVWDYRCPHRNAEGQRATLVRATRYEAAAIAALLANERGAE